MNADADHRATLSRIIDISGLKDHGAEFVIEADDEQKKAVAARLDVPSVKTLRGVFTMRPMRGGAAVDLRLKAELERRCVVSLEPMVETIDEEISMVFDRNFVEADDDRDDDDEWREPLDGDEIDLGELLVQHLSLALDPYPRRQDADSLLDEYRSAATASPFEALKALKKPNG